MNYLRLLPVLLAALVLSTGCATVQPVVQDHEPLFVQYDIQYVDNTMIGVDLLVLSSDETVTESALEKHVYRSVKDVADAMGQSDILADQMQFRDSLESSLRDRSPFGESVRIVVVDVLPGTWVAQR